jgi:hypothetical protein
MSDVWAWRLPRAPGEPRRLPAHPTASTWVMTSMSSVVISSWRGGGRVSSCFVAWGDNLQAEGHLNVDVPATVRWLEHPPLDAMNNARHRLIAEDGPTRGVDLAHVSVSANEDVDRDEAVRGRVTRKRFL